MVLLFVVGIIDIGILVIDELTNDFDTKVKLCGINVCTILHILLFLFYFAVISKIGAPDIWKAKKEFIYLLLPLDILILLLAILLPLDKVSMKIMLQATCNFCLLVTIIIDISAHEYETAEKNGTIDSKPADGIIPESCIV